MDPLNNNQPNDAPGDPGLAPPPVGPAPDAPVAPVSDPQINAPVPPSGPEPNFNEPTTVAMNAPATPDVPSGPAPDLGAPTPPSEPSPDTPPAGGPVPVPGPAGPGAIQTPGTMPGAGSAPAHDGKKGLPMPVLIVAAVVLIGVILALILL